MTEVVRTRFAPSPTGYLHVGGARTALFNWLFARKNNGVFVLRIEDTDKVRSTQEAVQAILNGMRWLGLNWDEGPEVGGNYGPYFQTQRLDTYNKYCEILLSTQAAYRKDGAVYFKSTDPKSLIEDFVIVRSDGIPVYNYAVVIDDALMKITHIIRGDDHLSNTPRQVMIYKALGLEIPKIVHVPMILGPDGQRLSKRHGATSVEEYQKQGILSEGMVNYLARLGWAYKDEEFFTIPDLIEKFSLNKVGKSPAIFDVKKLEWINGEHIKKATPDRLKQFLPEKYQQYPNIDKIIALGQSRMKNIEQVISGCKYYFDDTVVIPDELKQGLPVETLKSLIPALQNCVWTGAEIEKTIRAASPDGKLILPLRIAITGGTVSPGMFEVLELLGKEKTLQRLYAL
jgi:glutamyl-tRNA synthetase